MAEKDLKYFYILKKEVAKKLQQSYSVSDEIKNWKGQDITFFQDDLSDKVNGRISEKWFYTHIKSDTKKLPRIDMLNILCEYCGYQNWNDFINKVTIEENPKSKPERKKVKWVLPLFLILAIVSSFLIFQSINKTTSYQFCFVDSDFNIPITDTPIWIIWMNENESPMISKCDSNGCFKFNTKKEQIQFIVRSPYYKSDTITRIVHNKEITQEQIQLKTNDYALMIHLFSKSKVNDWKKRRNQLNEMFADNARIYQVSDDEITGVELYNKRDFINKMTVPLKSLKNIEIIETIYRGDKIAVMRFKQSIQENE